MKAKKEKTKLYILISTCALVCFSFGIADINFNPLEKSSFSKTTDGKNSFYVKNIENVLLPIEKIYEIYKFSTIEFGGGFRCVITAELAATDYGPYRELYFIFNNAFEMPHRSAVFKIGNLARITSFYKVSDTVYKIKGEMFYNEKIQTYKKVIITIDAKSLIDKEKQYIDDDDYTEGNIDSEVKVTVMKQR